MRDASMRKRLSWWWDEQKWMVLPLALYALTCAVVVGVYIARRPEVTAPPTDGEAIGSALVFCLILWSALRPTDYAKAADVRELKREIERLREDVARLRHRP